MWWPERCWLCDQKPFRWIYREFYVESMRLFAMIVFYDRIFKALFYANSYGYIYLLAKNKLHYNFEISLVKHTKNHHCNGWFVYISWPEFLRHSISWCWPKHYCALCILHHSVLFVFHIGKRQSTLILFITKYDGD